jgi:hypothetical protein
VCPNGHTMSVLTLSLRFTGEHKYNLAEVTPEKESETMEPIEKLSRRQKACDLAMVLMAYADGETIQCRMRNDGGLREAKWCDTESPLWNFYEFDFRVKPAPREVWVNEYDKGLAQTTHPTKKDAIRCSVLGRMDTVKFVEAVK